MTQTELRMTVQHLIDTGQLTLNGQRPVIVPEHITPIRRRTHALRRGLSIVYCSVMAELCEASVRLADALRPARIRSAFWLDDV